MRAIVIDIGGTNFRIGVFTESAEIVDLHQFSTPNFINHPDKQIDELQELLLDTLFDHVSKYKKKYPEITAAGLSFPSPITDTGIVLSAATLWGAQGAGFPILEKLNEKELGVTWTVVNDITAAGQRYAQMNKFKSEDYICVITVSSGNGNKVYDMRNGKVILDRKSIGGEIGHIQYDLSQNALQCDCGGYGHIGAYSSGRAVERLVQKTAAEETETFRKSLLGKSGIKAEEITNIEIIKAIKSNDSFVIDLLDKSTLPLTYAIGFISGSIGVGKFIFIGGFALNAGQQYIDSLHRNLMKIDFYNRSEEEIKNLVELGKNDGLDCLIGVGLLTNK